MLLSFTLYFCKHFRLTVVSLFMDFEKYIIVRARMNIRSDWHCTMHMNERLHAGVQRYAGGCVKQARSKSILIGQAILYCNTVRVRYMRTCLLGGSGGMLPQKICKNYTSLDAIWCILDKILL